MSDNLLWSSSSLWRFRALRQRRRHFRPCWEVATPTSPDFLGSKRTSWPGWKPVRGRRNSLRGRRRWSLCRRRSCSLGCSSQHLRDKIGCVWWRKHLETSNMWPLLRRLMQFKIRRVSDLFVPPASRSMCPFFASCNLYLNDCHCKLTMQCLSINLGSAENWTRHHWVRSAITNLCVMTPSRISDLKPPKNQSNMTFHLTFVSVRMEMVNPGQGIGEKTKWVQNPKSARFGWRQKYPRLTKICTDQFQVWHFLFKLFWSNFLSWRVARLAETFSASQQLKNGWEWIIKNDEC